MFGTLVLSEILQKVLVTYQHIGKHPSFLAKYNDKPNAGLLYAGFIY